MDSEDFEPGQAWVYTVYAIWARDTNNNGIPDFEENIMRVVYFANGGLGDVPVDNFPYGLPTDSNPYANLATVLGNVGGLHHIGFTWAGWNTAADGSGTQFAAGDGVRLDSDLVLFAQWNPHLYPVVFMDFDPIADEVIDVPISTVSVYFGTQISGTRVPSNPTPPNIGWVFAGWTIDGSDLFNREAVANLYMRTTGGLMFTAVYVESASAMIIFDINGGSLASGVSNFRQGQPATAFTAPIPTRDGYTFAGWQLNGNANQTTLENVSYPAHYPASGTFGIESTITIYVAIWNANYYDVVFVDVVPGTPETVSTVSVAFDTVIGVGNVPENRPNPVDYIFLGWTDGIGVFSQAEVGAIIMNSVGGMTFTAVYEAAVYETIALATVIFDFAGGTNGSTGFVIVTGLPGTPLTAPTGLTRVGYTLAVANNGWSTEVPANFGAAGTTTTFTAVWVRNNVEVTFNEGSQGSIPTNPTVESVPFGRTLAEESIAVPAVTPNANWNFIGWESDLGGIFTSAQVAALPITEAVTFTALYSQYDVATVIFGFADGANDSTGFVIVSGLPGTALTAPANQTRTDYAFNGWLLVGEANGTTLNTDTPATGTFGTAGTTTTFMAVWGAGDLGEHTVTFNAGASGTMTPTEHQETVLHGESVNQVPTISANNRFTFIGWSMNGGSSLFSSADILTMAIIADTTFVAMYQQTTVTGGGGGGGGIPTPLSTITINCIDEYGNIIFTQMIVQVQVGSTQMVNAPDLEGFTLNDDRTKTITVVAASAQNVVEFRYVRSVELERESHFRYLFGFPDGTIRPDNNITREEVATIFFRLLTIETRNRYRTRAHTFLDVSTDRWSVESIATMQNTGVLFGRDDGTFDPVAPITRAEFSAIAMRFDRISANYTHGFSDIAGHWAEQMIAAASQRGWITGYPDGTFRPDQPITRAEAATLINRVLGRQVDQVGLYAPIVPNFTDLSVTHWAYFDIIEATVSHTFERRYDDGRIIENWTGRGEDVNF